MKNGKIIYVALLVADNGIPGEIEDAINEMIRPATQDSERSLIVDYAFNSDGNAQMLPAPVPYKIPTQFTDYEEGDFLGKLIKGEGK